MILRGWSVSLVHCAFWASFDLVWVAASGSAVVVRSITSRPSNDDTVVVAGTFASAGLLACEAVCAWSVQNKQWSALGTGIKGDVSSVAYAGVCEYSISDYFLLIISHLIGQL
jgi:hypothetical protein